MRLAWSWPASLLVIVAFPFMYKQRPQPDALNLLLKPIMLVMPSPFSQMTSPAQLAKACPCWNSPPLPVAIFGHFSASPRDSIWLRQLFV
eukprot:5242894-Pleurochrysis_carterae.AAC.6